MSYGLTRAYVLNISFLGGAGEVTGSKYLVTGNTEAGPYRYCVDFGMFQGGQEALERNLADALENPSSSALQGTMDHFRIVKQSTRHLQTKSFSIPYTQLN